MKSLLLATTSLAAISLTLGQTTASSPDAVEKANGKALAIVAPPPRYPIDQQGRRPTGRGIVVMQVDTKTGWVVSAKMEKSTGNKLLDSAALDASSRWRFKPGAFHYVRSPISFNNNGQPRS